MEEHIRVIPDIKDQKDKFKNHNDPDVEEALKDVNILGLKTPKTEEEMYSSKSNGPNAWIFIAIITVLLVLLIVLIVYYLIIKKQNDNRPRAHYSGQYIAPGGAKPSMPSAHEHAAPHSQHGHPANAKTRKPGAPHSQQERETPHSQHERGATEEEVDDVLNRINNSAAVNARENADANDEPELEETIEEIVDDTLNSTADMADEIADFQNDVLNSLEE